MSKRSRKKASPNLPQQTLDRARRQAAGEEVVGEEPAPPKPEKKAESKPKAEQTAPAPTKSREERRQGRENRPARRQVQSAQYSQRKDRNTMDPSQVQFALTHPTINVTEEQLHEEYGFVLADLRNMGLLAAVLMVVLVLLAQFI